MQVIRDISSDYELENINNIDESRLFYRIGPHQTYLTSSENRREACSTKLQKYRRRVSIFMCVNADASDIFPVSYIGTASKPKCFTDPRFAPTRQRYWPQANGRMDNKGFVHWIQQWCKHVQKLSTGPCSLLMDNCGGHDTTMDLAHVPIEFLPPKSTMKHQTLDMGLIATAKKRDKSKLLSAILDIIELKRNINYIFKEKSENGKWRLQDGFRFSGALRTQNVFFLTRIPVHGISMLFIFRCHINRKNFRRAQHVIIYIAVHASVITKANVR